MGLENETHTVNEDDEDLQICVIVYSPVNDCLMDLPFEVVFAASSDTAGIYINTKSTAFNCCSYILFQFQWKEMILD